MIPYASLGDMQLWAASVMDSRSPDFIIGPGDVDYLRRWWIVPRNEFLNLYLHLTLRGDDDRALHDHPWANTSYVLEGGYWEVMPTGSFWRAPGDVITREATDSHRLIIPEGGQCVSLFATGPKVREWGFHCPNGWRHWKEFTGFDETGDSANVGRGCD